jgi:hypothetical protein
MFMELKQKRLNVDVDRKLVESLQAMWGNGLSLPRTVNRALILLSRYNPRLLEARDYDLLNSFQIPETMKVLLLQVTGAKTWQAAVMDIIVEYLDKKVTYIIKEEQEDA